MAATKNNKRVRVKPYRRALQYFVLISLLLIPLGSQNPVDWSPSRIVQGQLPAPASFSFVGDTWSFGVNTVYLSHPLAFVDTWLSGRVVYLPLLLSALLPMALTIIFGRFFCAWICPMGTLLELNMKLRGVLQKIGVGWNITIPDRRYVILLACIVIAFLLATPVLSIVDPPHTLGRELMTLITHQKVTFSGLIFLLALFCADTFISPRMTCSKLCPSGAGLAFLGSKKLLRIRLIKDQCVECGKCNEICPYDLLPMNLIGQEEFNWVKCDNCGLCRDVCPTGAIEYCFNGEKQVNLEKSI